MRPASIGAGCLGSCGEAANHEFRSQPGCGNRWSEDGRTFHRSWANSCKLAGHLHAGAPIVRAMPNLAAEVGRGITAAYANSHVTMAQRDLCHTLLQAVGEVAWIEDESFMDAVTAVSGSGPAYVFYLTECLAKAAEAKGLPPELASSLARATVTGAGELLHRSPLSAAQLRENVTSPGGTTTAGLRCC